MRQSSGSGGIALMAAVLGGIAILACAVPADAADAVAVEATEKGYGQRLVEAARRQTWWPVVYNSAYRKIPYPMGDVPWYLGVCTDVVVRAYRELGIDLQELVHRARVGSGDTNIDHRRVPVLKAYFSRAGETLPVSKNAADYRPGDIVTYDLPAGYSSRTHIVIVSDRRSRDGTPLVLHNRGFGVVEEDWLFAERISGRFRFRPRQREAASRVLR
jgi:uncharacterized protein YijF (DUF1287 family)